MKSFLILVLAFATSSTQQVLIGSKAAHSVTVT